MVPSAILLLQSLKQRAPPRRRRHDSRAALAPGRRRRVFDGLPHAPAEHACLQHVGHGRSGRLRSLAEGRASAPRAQLDARGLRAPLLLRRLPAGAPRRDPRDARICSVVLAALHRGLHLAARRGLGSDSRARRAHHRRRRHSRDRQRAAARARPRACAPSVQKPGRRGSVGCRAEGRDPDGCARCCSPAPA